MWVIRGIGLDGMRVGFDGKGDWNPGVGGAEAHATGPCEEVDADEVVGVGHGKEAPVGVVRRRWGRGQGEVLGESAVERKVLGVCLGDGWVLAVGRWKCWRRSRRAARRERGVGRWQEEKGEGH